MHLVVVSGLPCSGKTRLATALAARWPQPLLSKDTLKELLFDTLGHADRGWSKRISGAAYALMFLNAEQLTRCAISCILEGNFRIHEQRAHFDRLQTLGAEFVQVHCHAESAVLIERFRERTFSGHRHPGHVDEQSLAEIESELRSTEQAPLPLPGPVIDCDTSGDWQRAIDAALTKTLALLAQDASG